MVNSVRFLRVDDRLIHGQVIVGWLPRLGTQAIVVANERVCADAMRQDMMRLSVPPDLEIHFQSPHQLAQLTGLPFECMVLVASPKDAWLCIQAGLVPETFNIGGLHAKSGKTEIFEALHLDDDDRAQFEAILKAGHHPVFQPTPQNEPVPLAEIL